MKTVHIPVSTAYDVCIGNGSFAEAGERIAAVTRAKKAMIVSDSNVYPLYGDLLREQLIKKDILTDTYIFPAGEKSKSVSVWSDLMDSLCDRSYTRGDIIVSLGGGVTGDLAGFAAAVYQRGIGYIQIPTTLLAAVDASVGGKTAINLPGGKNQAGCFHQPLLVLCDPGLFGTLPENEYRSACAEVVKCAMIADETMFSRLESISLRDMLTSVITDCVSIKRDLIVQDEFDTGNRMLLNFGHTVGHAIEFLSGYSLSHGECVAAGMAAMTRAACAAGYCGPDVPERLIALLHSNGLPTEVSFSADELSVAAAHDKKRCGTGIKIILPEKIGQCRIVGIQSDRFPALLRMGGIR